MCKTILFVALLLAGSAETASAQDVALEVQEAESQAVQDFKITLASEASDVNGQFQNSTTLLRNATAIAQSVNVSTENCNNDELTTDDNIVVSRISSLGDTYKVAVDGEIDRYAELKGEYDNAGGYAQAMVLYNELISAKGRREMYSALGPTMQLSIEAARQETEAGCLMRRIGKLHQHPKGLNPLRDGIQVSELSRQWFVGEAHVFDILVNYVNKFRL